MARWYPIEILALGTLTHKAPGCLQVGNGSSDVITDCASSILAGCVQCCFWARGLLFQLVQSLVYVVPGSVCEEHIDDLSQVVTNSSHDAAQIGKDVRRHSQIGPDLVLQIYCPGKRQIDGETDRWSPRGRRCSECQGAAATDLGIETAAVKRKMRVKPMETPGKAGEGRRESTAYAR